MFRYYLTQRPPMPWAFPQFAANVVSFDDRKEVPNLTSRVWGYVEYEAVTDLDVVYDENYDLVRLFLSELDESEYEGDVFTLRDGRKVIVPTAWN